ncbi:PadR family transcriptional regulator PadR [Paenibacillus mucilaginosus]|uniref:PadR family transcriptional regulator n=1 Tax=Paenibacillus mucilaginosus TaxID=61624 RepID=UPI003D23216C
MFSQLMKGVLEGCVLAIIAEEETYGYEIMEKLAARGFRFAKEGSIYPLLLRLEREKLIESSLRPSSSGPNRKYYRLSGEGANQLAQFRGGWEELSQAVDAILQPKG